jgi:hypothetical protein
MNSLDTKANNFIIIAGIVVGLYSGFGKSILDSIDKTKVLCDSVTYYNLFLFTLIIGIIILLVSICCALFAYRAYNIHAVPDASYFYENYVKNDNCTKGNILDNLTLALVSANKSNKEDALNKASYVTVSLISLLLGSGVCVIFVVLALIATRM